MYPFNISKVRKFKYLIFIHNHNFWYDMYFLIT